MHELLNDDYLLIKRSDDMSFSCEQALIYSENISYQSPSKAKVNLLGNHALQVCSWTNIDISSPVNPNAGIQHLEPIAIHFNPENKTLSYTFVNQNTGKKIQRTAKYKNGTFKIKSYDARTLEE